MNKSIYEVTPPAYEGSSETITRTDPDGRTWWIPADPANSDYQKYLAQLQEEAN
jgi:hypothetical protein